MQQAYGFNQITLPAGEAFDDAGSGLDWFWVNYAKDSTNRKATDLLN